MDTTPLGRLIAEEIRHGGPIPLDRYIDLCLAHPVHGYYRTRDPFGAAGDFVTAPEISQMFGELLGVWVAATRAAMGSPRRLNFVELGPGRGTLMADALRALARLAPDAAIDLHLVEIGPVLRGLQEQSLRGRHAVWHDSVETLPGGPLIVLANEFFDALPVRQFERTAEGWCERLVGLDAEGRLRWGLRPESDRRIEHEAPPGSVLTLPSAALAVVRTLARRIVREGGACLMLDYGHVRPGFGDTLQAVQGHRFVDPLARPGEADLTVHVDFSALARAAEGESLRVHGPTHQGEFLLALGLRQRADRLKQGTTPEQAEAIETAFARLTDPALRGMGSLFKVLGVSHPSLDALPGLPATT